MPTAINIAGQKFGRLTVKHMAGIAANKERTWLCVCDCGNETIAKGYYLRKGVTKSCGCLQTETRIKHGHTLGKRDTPTYKSWENMMQRCTNPKHHHWHKYGGSGISVCDSWRTFANFLADMGERPQGTTLDRIEGSNGYSPDNCKWSSIKDQQRNRKTCKRITWNGKTQTMVEWAEELKIPYATLESRLRHGMTTEKAFTQRRLKGSPVFLD